MHPPRTCAGRSAEQDRAPRLDGPVDGHDRWHRHLGQEQASTTWIGPDELATHNESYWATLSAGSRKLTGSDGDTTLERNALTMEHGKHSITAKVDKDKASLILSSDGLHRAVEIIAGMYYATVGTVFLPDDLGPPFSGQLGADKDGGALTVADGNVERSFNLKRLASPASRR